MRLALHTVIYCCVFSTVLPLVKGATGELNTSLKKRFRVWLQNRIKRDLCSDWVPANEQDSDSQVGPQQDGNAETISPLSSFGLNIRPRRATASKQSGCVLVTCAYHDLLYRVYQHNTVKVPEAPQNKIASTGYGRRRRSLQDVTRLALQTRRQRHLRSREDGQRLIRHTSTTVAWDRNGEAKENPCWGYLLTADEDKSTQTFYSTDLQLDMQKERLPHLYSLSEEDLLSSHRIKARLQCHIPIVHA